MRLTDGADSRSVRFRVVQSILLWCSVTVMMRFLSRAPPFFVFPPLPVPLFALNLPGMLVAMAGWNMVYLDMLLLLNNPLQLACSTESNHNHGAIVSCKG
jgi:uncharacterized membrane protein